MKNIAFYFVFVATLFVFQLTAQIERVIVETYYISGKQDSIDIDGGKLDTGSVTYRVFIDLKKGNKLLSLYGDANHALKFSSTKPFFNNVDGKTYGKDIPKGLYNQGTVPLDTWLTLGQAALNTSDGKANYGIPKLYDSNGSFVGGSNNDQGLLTNSISAIGIPLTTADGMMPKTLTNYTWSAQGIRDAESGKDSTMFGSDKVSSQFVSREVYLTAAPGVSGVVEDSNQVLVAQLTTTGKLEFELNVLVLRDGIGDTARYVANADILIAGKKEFKSSFLKFPFPKAICGCKDPAYLEYNPDFECLSVDSCKRRIVFGCTDTMACNFNPKANFSVKAICCYPGSCGSRDITVVCPIIKGESFEADVFPNPAQNSLFLNVTTGQSVEMSYQVFNCFGTEVVFKKLGATLRVENHEIDLTMFNSGLYLIRINVGGKFVAKQFFKN